MTRLLVALAMGCVAATQDFRAGPGGPIGGTFLQFRFDDQWNDARLRGLLRDVRRLGLSHIVLQWTVVGNKAFYRSEAFESVPEPPLEPLLQLADESGVAVRVGLASDPEFWNKIKIDSPQHDVETYLQASLKRSVTAARELMPIVSRHRSFEGWFLTEEVDDVNWLTPERRELLHSFLGDLRRTLHASGSPASVSLSGFSNANCDPSMFEAFWTAILDGTNIDTVFFQDGIGAHKLDFPYLPLYLTAIKRAVASKGRGLSVVAELFDQVAGPPVTEGAFKAVPAGLDRLVRQLAVDSKASTSGVYAFSVPDYMVPEAGPQAQRLFADYIQHFHLPSTSP